MPVLRDESDALYVSKILKLALDVEVGCYSEDWLGYCISL